MMPNLYNRNKMQTEQKQGFPKGFSTADRKSWFDEGDRTIPGPGTHESHRVDRITCPEWKMGNSTGRDGFLQLHNAQLPSPQHYTPNDQALAKHSPQAVIPKGKGGPKNSEAVCPLYHPDARIVKTKYPQFSFGYAAETNYGTVAPGPGAYEGYTGRSVSNKTQRGLSTALRPLSKDEAAKVPGPGKYLTIDSERGIEYTFTKGVRDVRPKVDPPARFYDIGPKRKAMRTTRFESTEIHREIEIGPPNENPAPNAYNNEKPKRHYNILIEKAKRSALENTAILEFPSPNTYDFVASLDKKPKGGSIPHEVRHLTATEKLVPGPGTYQAAPTLARIGGALPKFQEKQDEKLVTPGSADYSPKHNITKRKAQSTIVFKSDRVDFSKTITGPIGPGAYHLGQGSQGQMGKIGRSQRQDPHSPDRNPGVGNYTLPGFFGKLPTYYGSPRKINESGYSTYHEKLKYKLNQRHRVLQGINKQDSEASVPVEMSTEQKEAINPEVTV